MKFYDLLLCQRFLISSLMLNRARGEAAKKTTEPLLSAPANSDEVFIPKKTFRDNLMA